MKSENQFLLKILIGTFILVSGLLFFTSQAQAGYKVSYDGTSFIVDSLNVTVEWNALGWGHYGLPWFAFNGSIVQYDDYYDLSSAMDYCRLLCGEEAYACQDACYFPLVESERLRFSTNLRVGQNSFEMASNNNHCDTCGCPWGPYWVCDGVYAKITFSNGQVLYTDGSWDGLGRPIIDLSYCGLYPHYLQSVTCGDCCETHARKFIMVEVACTPSCRDWSACSVYCGGGTQSRTCTRADCSTYTETQSCNIPPCAPTGLNAVCPVP